MLMHSWSFSAIYEDSGLKKGFHYAGDPAMHEKFLYFLDFLRQIPQVELSTLRDTAALLKNEGATRYYDTRLFTFEDAASPLSVRVSCDENVVVAKAAANKNIFQGEVEYAFYLLVNGQKTEVKWYTATGEACFSLPKDGAIKITAFAREKANPENKRSKTIVVGTVGPGEVYFPELPSP
jgi:hypothetical protein